jgi:16S rRNA (uracil1498-N3)-methyltransferase
MKGLNGIGGHAGHLCSAMAPAACTVAGAPSALGTWGHNGSESMIPEGCEGVGVGAGATPRMYIEMQDWLACAGLVGQVEAPGVGGAGLLAGQTVTLPAGPSRHIQVLRMQPGDEVCLFTGDGLDWPARIASMGRKEVAVTLSEPVTGARVELPWGVTLAVGMPANDRMDALVEKATELGVDTIAPLVCARSVLRLDGERAAKKVAHWQGVAVAASEQSARNKVPRILPVMPFKQWLGTADAQAAARGVLSFKPEHSASAWLGRLAVSAQGTPASLGFLSGPEGGLTPEEEAAARQAGWAALGLGPRVLRADTAPLMALALVAGLLEG